MAKILAITNQKGGVGKTTSAITISSIYAELLNKKVLLIDMDPQGNASTGLGIYPKDIQGTIYHALIKSKEVKEVIYSTYLPNLFIIPASPDLGGAETELAKLSVGSQFRLKEIIQSEKDTYDIIVIDCPPSVGLLNINALTLADECIIPMQAELYSIQGVQHLKDTISLVQKYTNNNLKLKGVLLTMVDSRTNLHQENEKQVRAYLGDLVFKTVIPKNIKLAEAVNLGESIITKHINSNGAQAYLKLVVELEALGEDNSIHKILNKPTEANNEQQ